MDRYLYLSIDIISILFPLLFSFYPKAAFYKQWRYLAISTFIPAVLFILWDILFTTMGVWGFNPRYITGIYFFNLPIEEVLFFICVPYACVFTYFALNNIVHDDYLKPYQELISSALCIVLIISGMYHLNKWYTGITFLLAGGFIAFQMIVLKPGYMGRFYFAFAVILIPFFIVNGILTGSFIEHEVVWYDNEENLGVRLGTIPLEDVFYGLLLLVMNVTLFEWQRIRNNIYT